MGAQKNRLNEMVLFSTQNKCLIRWIKYSHFFQFLQFYAFLFIHVDPYVYRKADDGLQKVSQQGQDQHVMPRDISNKHIMAYGMYSL